MIELSRVETEVARYVARGYQNDEIAAARGCSIHTVRNAIVNVQQKLGARNRTQVAVKAVYHHIIDLEEAARA